MYSSGASETKAKCPRASVVVLALCEGLVTLTTTPGSGIVVPNSETMPLIPPVVPARTGTLAATLRAIAIATYFNFIGTHPC